MDLGGGLGITYKKEKSPSIPKYCALIRKHFGPKSGLKRRLKILIEPGRSISGNAGVLVTEVLYRKVRGEKDFLIVDAAMNDLARPSLYGSHHEILPVRKSAKTRLKKTDIVGPVCESTDYLGRDRKLPLNLNQGDLLAILSAGAYGFSMAGNYNSRPRPAEVLVQGGKLRVIRARDLRRPHPGRDPAKTRFGTSIETLGLSFSAQKPLRLRLAHVLGMDSYARRFHGIGDPFQLQRRAGPRVLQTHPFGSA